MHGRFDGVGRDAAAAEGLAAVLDREVDFAEGVVAERGAADLVVDALELDAGDLFGGQKRGVDRAVAVGDFRGVLLVAAAERQLRPRLVAAAAGDLERDELPFLFAGRRESAARSGR